MKLYTEEQVRKAFCNGIKYASTIRPASINHNNQYVEGIINSLTPIQLPSDEEIEKARPITLNNPQITQDLIWMMGAKWIKEQILNQNK